ncbi:MAG: multidrug effflux MFS transporter [Hyphomicrobiales bacterium]
MVTQDSNRTMHLGEQVALVALMISLVALCIDAMLPALDIIGADLNVSSPNDAQLVVSSFFIGLAFGQMFYGPWSDSAGRRLPIYIGFAMFFAGTAISIFAHNFETMLAGRFLQGFGAAGPRIVTIAVIRDQYAGRGMARVMSMIMAVFILVPAIAPALGQAVMLFAGWRAIFWSFLIIGFIAFTWFAVRQPETLPPEARMPFSLKRIFAGIAETSTNRIAFGYTLGLGMIFAPFVGYLVSAQAVFTKQYGLAELFPIYFGALALAVGVSSVINSKLVVKHGMRYLSRVALIILCALAFPFLALTWVFDGNPPLWIMMTFFMLMFLVIGVAFGNFNAMAMEPMGHIAGIAAAFIASVSTFISVPLGTWIGLSFNGTIYPLVIGFAVFGAGALVAMEWTEWGAEAAEAS